MNYTEKNQELIAITSEYSDFLSKALDRYSKSKVYTSAFLDWCDSTKQNPLTPSMSANVANCASWLKFRDYEKNGHKLTNARFCKKDKICPACAMRRASKQVNKVYNELNSNPELMTGYWYYIVLPVKHNSSEEFGTVFDRLGTGLKGINQALRNQARNKDTNNFFAHFDGIMYSIEETKTKNGWNIHANLLCRSEKPVKGLKKKKGGYWTVHASETWKELTNSSNVSINPIDISSDEALMKNLMEVFKYSLKFQDLAPQDLLTAYRGTYRKRLLGTMGTLRSLTTNVELNGDDILDDLFTESRFVFIKNKFQFRGHHRGRIFPDGYTITEADNYE